MKFLILSNTNLMGKIFSYLLSLILFQINLKNLRCLHRNHRIVIQVIFIKFNKILKINKIIIINKLINKFYIKINNFLIIIKI